jgi:hypothetical protein
MADDPSDDTDDPYVVVLAPAPTNQQGTALDTDDPLVLAALHHRVDALDGTVLDTAVTAAGSAGLDEQPDGRELLHRAVDVVVPWNRLVNTLVLDDRPYLVTGETIFEMHDFEEPGLLAALAASGITSERLADDHGGEAAHTTPEDLRLIASWLAGLVTDAGNGHMPSEHIKALTAIARLGADTQSDLSPILSMLGTENG